MKIVILTGGTGSIALQLGLHGTLEKDIDGVDIKVIVNAYDNGLSTGAVRRVMNGKILGPSDVRKNQTTRLSLASPNDPFIDFLNHRFSIEPHLAFDFCRSQTAQLVHHLEQSYRDVDFRTPLLGGIDEFFRQSVARELEYQNFSLSNIIYAGLAHSHANSLRAAAALMARILNVPDNVLLNDDKSLFLGAITRSGRRLEDEGDIVSRGDESDPFVDIFFVDDEGKQAWPVLCFEAWTALLEANLIILSSGTQWSSLIPTYSSRGFVSAIRDSKAKILLVVNRAPDKDAPGLTASGIIELLVPKYFDPGRLHVLADRNGHPQMRELTSLARSIVASFTQADLSSPESAAGKHHPSKLANAVGYAYFQEYLHSKFFLFDYDDTLLGRENTYPRSSRLNIEGILDLNELTDVGICTGNTVRALELRQESSSEDERDHHKPMLVFADGGVNEYTCDTGPTISSRESLARFVACIDPDNLLPLSGQYSFSQIKACLIRAGIPAPKISNRGGAIIAIKPIDHQLRPALVRLASSMVQGTDLKVCESGRTTVEIRGAKLSKVRCLHHLCANRGVANLTYIGDECEVGNDYEIASLAEKCDGIKCLHVKGPSETAFFIITLLNLLRRNAAG